MAAVKLPLATLKDIRDNFDGELPKLTQEIADLLKEPYAIKFDFPTLYSGITEDGWGKNNLGSVARDCLKDFIYYFRRLSNEGGKPEVAEFFNKIVTKREIAIALDPGCPSYSGCRVHEGVYQITFKPASFGTKTSGCNSEMQKLLDKALFENNSKSFPLAARIGIRDEFEGKKDELVKSIVEDLNDTTTKITLNADYGKIWGTIVSAWESLPKSVSLAALQTATSTPSHVAMFGTSVLKKAASATSLLTGLAYPGVPRVTGNPVLGILHEMKSNVHATLGRLWKAAGADGLAYGWLATKPVVLLRSPELIREVLVRNKDNISRTGPDSNGPLAAMQRVLGDSVLTSEGKSWRHQRNAVLESVFTPAALNHSFDTMVEVTRKHAEQMKEKGRDSALEQSFVHYTMDVAGQAALGAHNISAHAPEFSEAMTEVLTVVASPGHWARHAFEAKLRGRDVRELDSREQEVLAKFNAIFRKKILDANAEIINPQRRTPNGIHTLFQKISRDSGGTPERPLTDELYAQAPLVLLAAHETSGTLLLWTVVELNRNPQVAVKLLEEVRKVWSNENPSPQSLKQMPYLDHVLHETLRMHSPAPFMARGVISPIMLDTATAGTVTLDKGTFVFISTQHVNRDPLIWGDDANEYRPERFETISVREKIEACEFLPFGAGHRRCPGFPFSIQESKIFLATMLFDSFLHLDDPDAIVPNYASRPLKVSRPVAATIKSNRTTFKNQPATKPIGSSSDSANPGSISTSRPVTSDEAFSATLMT